MRASMFCFVVLALGACKDVPKNDEATPSSAAQAGGEAGAEGEATAKEPLPDAATLLQQSAEASGGREKIDAIESYHVTGKVSAPKIGVTGSTEMWWKGGDFFMVQTLEGIGTTRSGKQGEVIWTDDPIYGLRRLQGQEAEQHWWASSLMLAAQWNRHFAKAETVAARETDGKTLYDVKLTSKSGTEVTLTLDAESKLQVAQAFEIVNPMGKTPAKTELDDYREVDGIKVPFKMRSDVTVVQMEQEITEVEFNVDVDASKFAMPTGDTEVVEGRPPEEPEAEDGADEKDRRP